MADNISFVSHNCRKLPLTFTDLHTRPDILNLFGKYDVIFLQETWLAKQQLELCSTLHADYLAYRVAAVNYSDRVLRAHPHGGVSVFVHKPLANMIAPVYFTDCN